MKTYAHLGQFSDIVDNARLMGPLHPLAEPGPAAQQAVQQVLGWCGGPDSPQDPRVEDHWQRDGLTGELIRWSVGYGPRTDAWLIKPAGTHEPLPGVLALHDHGGYKYHGKEKIADGPEPAPDLLRVFREKYYGGRAWVNALAKEGFAVLVHDTFLWGSRGFSADLMRSALQLNDEPPADPDDLNTKVNEYNRLTAPHENLVAKYLNLMGTSLAGVVSYEDRVALNYLRSRPDVLTDRLGCMGLSGGGCRAGLLRATAPHLRAAVVVGMMTTYEGLLDHNVHHTWMFYPYGWSRCGDWPDLVACRAPAPLLVQYDLDDGLFTQDGMRAADQRLRKHYASAGDDQAYTGQFYPGPHKFDLDMQAAAFRWLRSVLA